MFIGIVFSYQKEDGNVVLDKANELLHIFYI